MEGSSWCPDVAAPLDDPSAVGSSSDWRKQLHPETRLRIVNKIMETLKRHLPISGPECLNELKKIAVRFEEKIYIAATNQSDYLRRISLKMLSMETENQGAAAINPSLSNPTIGNQSPSESVNSTTQMGPADTVAVNSTTQTGHADTVDWQEEVYQKVKSMKELYYDQICELQQRTNLKIQQLTQTNALVAPAKPSEPLEKLKQFVQTLERTKMFLQTTKDNFPPSLKDNLPFLEKQITSLLASNRIAKREGLQFQHQPSLISVASIQQGSAPLLNIPNALQSPSLGQIQGNSFSSLQLGAIGQMQSGGFGSLQNAYQPYMFNGFGSLQNYASANQQRLNELPLQAQLLLLEQHRQLHSIQQKQQVPVQMNGVSQDFGSGSIQQKQQVPVQMNGVSVSQDFGSGSIQQKQQVPVQMNGVSQDFGSGLHHPYFLGVPQQNIYQPLKPSSLFPNLSQQNLQTAPLQSSVGIPLQPASSTIVSPRFTPIASSPTASKSVSISETESRVVTADQVAALENRVTALKNQVVSLEKFQSVILFALFFALFVGSYILW